MRPSDPCNADVTLSKSHKNESQSHELHTRTPNLNLTNLIDEWIDWCQWGRLVWFRPSAPCHVNVTLYETKFMTRNDSLSWLSWHDSNHATLNVTTKWSVSSISKKKSKNERAQCFKGNSCTQCFEGNECAQCFEGTSNVMLYETKFVTCDDSLSWWCWHESNHAMLNATKWSVSSISDLTCSR